MPGEIPVGSQRAAKNFCMGVLFQKRQVFCQYSGRGCVTRDGPKICEITNEPYMRSNYEKIVKTTTTDLLNNKL